MGPDVNLWCLLSWGSDLEASRGAYRPLQLWAVLPRELGAECLPSCSIGRVRCVLMKFPCLLNTRLMRSATDLVSCIARDYLGYKGRVCTSAARGRRSVYPISERRVQVSCRRDCWWAVLSFRLTILVSKLFSDVVGNYTSKTVRFRVEFDPHYNALSTPNTPLLSDPSSSSGSTWSPLGTPVMNSGRTSIGNPALFAGTSAGHSTHTSQHMRHPSASLRNSRTGGSSTSGNSRFSVNGVSVAGIVCTASFVQEKGAYSTLRIVYAKVKDGWK